MFPRRFSWLHEAQGCHGNSPRSSRRPEAAHPSIHPSIPEGSPGQPRRKGAPLNKHNYHQKKHRGASRNCRANNCFIVEQERGIADPSSTYSPLCKADSSSPGFPPLPAPEFLFYFIFTISILVFLTIIFTAQAICISISAEPTHSQSYHVVLVLLRLVYFLYFESK